MWRFTCLPRTVYDFLYPFKPLFRCSQARHFVIFCWFWSPSSAIRGQEHSRALPLFAPASVLLGADPDVTLRQMGCTSRHEWDG